MKKKAYLKYKDLYKGDIAKGKQPQISSNWPPTVYLFVFSSK